jgi:hypothetical protein
MMEILYAVLGLSMIASWGYMIVMQFKSVYKDRTTFGKIVTWFSISTWILYMIGTISNNMQMQ